MTTGTWLLAFTILSSSFFGSWHCGAMCGPIASFMKSRGGLIHYHLGRFFSYVGLGAIAGYTGSFFLESSFQHVRLAAAVILAITLALFGLKMLFPGWLKKVNVSSVLHRIVSTVHELTGRKIYRSGFALGFLNGLLPCGWLYTYVLAAITTKSPLAGAITMTLFWLGSLPILTAVPSLLKSGIATAGPKQQRIAGTILLVSSIYSISMFMVG